MTKLSDSLKVTLHGHGDQTIIFGNGFGTTQAVWQPLVNSFKAQFRIVTFDTAGSTPSSLLSYNPSRHAKLFGFAEDLAEVVNTFDLYDSIYIGHSVSAMIGILAALYEPTMFTRIVCIGGSACYVDDNEHNYIGGFSQADLQSMESTMLGQYYDWASGFSLLAMDNPEQPKLAADFTESLSALRPDIAIKILMMILHSDHRSDAKQFASLNIPTLILQSQRDVAVPIASGQWLAQAVGGTFSLLDAEGHFPHIVKPASVQLEIERFLVTTETT